MVLKLTEWSPSGQGPTVYDMAAADSWDRLIEDYAHPTRTARQPLIRIFEIARAHGVVCVVKEPRYIDADWRSKLARFYNGAFRRYPSVCHRLHFFTRAVDPDLLDLSNLQDAYRGYTILRPLPVAPVGRTMITPPPELDDAVRCEGDEPIDLFGWSFTIRSMPFISQDTQLLRCAHAALWMLLRYGSMVHRLPTRLPADIHDAALGGMIVGRQLPSDGLSAFQLMSAMSTLGLSPTSKALPQTAADETVQELGLYGMVCRYLNSRLPPIIISTCHAWVMVAYKRAPSNGNPVIGLWRHDDARGPYLYVDDPWNEPDPAHQPWLSAYLPLLPKAHLDAERAEAVGRKWIDFYRLSTAYTGSALEEADGRPDPQDQATLRTFLIESNTFKQELRGRDVPPALAAAFRRTPMSRYIWVIEVVNRQARAANRPDVIGEVVLDATLTQYEPDDDPNAIISLHVDDFAFVSGLDGAPNRTVPMDRSDTYTSACSLLRGSSSRHPTS